MIKGREEINQDNVNQDNIYGDKTCKTGKIIFDQ